MRAIELVTNSDQLAAFEFGRAQAAPAFGRADQCGIHELEHSALAERMRDRLVRSPFLTKQPLGHGPDGILCTRRTLTLRDEEEGRMQHLLKRVAEGD